LSVLIDATTRIVIQGITGREARMVAEHMMAYGSNLVAGVTPGRGGTDVSGVPVFDTLAEAVERHSPNATLISVPPAAVLDACLEALSHQLRLLAIATEGVPRHDAMLILEKAHAAAARVIGPNSVGVINPVARAKIGAIGGDHPERAFPAGRIGIISRSGGMTSEIGLMTRRVGLGVSTAVSVGGDALIGTPPAQLLPLFERDAETDGVVLFGEPGTNFEEDVAAAIQQRRFTKPLIAMVAGRFSETLPEGTAFGHAAAMIERGAGRPSDKVRLLRDAGVLIADDMEDLLQYLSMVFKNQPYLGSTGNGVHHG
jgi:succinyl-CoA synthetase alpha subunit